MYLMTMCTYSQSTSVVCNGFNCQHSDMSDLAKCYPRFLKHNITVFSELVLCVIEGSMGKLRDSSRPQVPTGYRMHTTGLSNNLFTVLPGL
jgi:hypothetical protein